MWSQLTGATIYCLKLFLDPQGKVCRHAYAPSP
jgi:hypothetical protein